VIYCAVIFIIRYPDVCPHNVLFTLYLLFTKIIINVYHIIFIVYADACRLMLFYTVPIHLSAYNVGDNCTGHWGWPTCVENKILW